MQADGVPADDSRAAQVVRLFTALWPDTVTCAAIAHWQGQWQWPRQAACVKAERLHLTLHFLGDFPTRRLPELLRALQVPFEPVTLDLGHGEVWPNGVAALRPARTPDALRGLHARVGDGLARLGVPLDERPYRPHVTLARRAHAATPPADGPKLRWRIDDGFVLARSLPGGAGYEIITRFD